jgi:hypothetical protein
MGGPIALLTQTTSWSAKGTTLLPLSLNYSNLIHLQSLVPWVTEYAIFSRRYVLVENVHWHRTQNTFFCIFIFSLPSFLSFVHLSPPTVLHWNSKLPFKTNNVAFLHSNCKRSLSRHVSELWGATCASTRTLHDARPHSQFIIISY